MAWYSWLAMASLAICIAGCIYHIVKLARLGKPRDYSKRSGSPAEGIIYSFTRAMNPAGKESAYLNLPTYAAGVIYHIGTLIAIILFFVLLFHKNINETITAPFAIFFYISTLYGTTLLIKRIADKKLRKLSTPDDYISNILVTGFHAATGTVLLLPPTYPAYMVIAGMLMIYLPVGKLKHAIYFFAARYHIGYFYGWRNVWSITKEKK